MNLTKTLPLVSFDEFKISALKINTFTSVPNGKRYKVVSVLDDKMHFIREDGNQDIKWSFNLKDIHKAYIELNDFKTISFKKYVPLRHSPARGLLYHLQLLKKR